MTKVDTAKLENVLHSFRYNPLAIISITDEQKAICDNADTHTWFNLWVKPDDEAEAKAKIYYDRLVKLLHERVSDIKILFTAPDHFVRQYGDRPGGYCNVARREIYIKPSPSYVTMFHALTHETSHLIDLGILRPYTATDATTAEVVAQTATYAVFHYLGLELINDFTSVYLSGLGIMHEYLYTCEPYSYLVAGTLLDGILD